MNYIELRNLFKNCSNKKELRNLFKNCSNKEEFTLANIVLCVSSSLLIGLDVSDDEFASICSYVSCICESVCNPNIPLIADMVVFSVYNGPAYCGLELTIDDLDNKSLIDEVIEKYQTLYYENEA